MPVRRADRIAPSQATGQGQFINLSQVQCMLLHGRWAIEQSATACVTRAPAIATRSTSRMASFRRWVPDKWVSRRDRRCDVDGARAGHRLDRSRTTEDEIETARSWPWTRQRSADEAMEILQRAAW